MNLPEELKAALEKELAFKKTAGLRNAREELSARYRERKAHETTFMTTEAHRLSYLATRMPATYAAVHAVLSELALRQPEIPPHSLMDMGSGPATAFWAAKDVFGTLRSATLVEQDGDLIAIGKRLLNECSSCNVIWKQQSIQSSGNESPHDLVIFSYSIGELPQELQWPAIENAWRLTREALVIVEPGTPAGFERILRLREHLLQAGAHLLAPCPNALPCPMSGGDWCHFAARLERTAEHRQVKGVSIGFEDEKYSYLIAGKAAVTVPAARILRHPQKHSGHLSLTLCTEGKLCQKTISKRDGDLYKKARKLEWGDSL